MGFYAARIQALLTARVVKTVTYASVQQVGISSLWTARIEYEDHTFCVFEGHGDTIDTQHGPLPLGDPEDRARSAYQKMCTRIQTETRARKHAIAAQRLSERQDGE